jgi:hypothetical protein
VAESLPGSGRTDTEHMDFDDLIEAQGPETRSAIFELCAALSPELLAFILNIPSTKVHNHNRSGLVHGTLGPGVESRSLKTTDIRDYAEQSGRYAIEIFNASYCDLSS